MAAPKLGQIVYKKSTNTLHVGDGSTVATNLPAVKGAYEGDLSTLTTSAKNTLVAAINEVNTYVDYFRNYSSSAEHHNSIYRGKYLGTTITAAQSAAIRNGTFNDLYVGDYWQNTYPAHSWTDENGTVHNENANAAVVLKWMIVGCNAFKLKPNNNNNVTGMHVVVMQYGGILHNRMNATNSTNGGYANSEAFKNVIPHFEAIIKTLFGEDHVMPHFDYFCNATENGTETGYTYYENRLCDLPSIEMIFGFPNNKKENFAGSLIQFPLFAMNPTMAVGGGTHTWLRDVESATAFRCIHYNGGVWGVPAATTNQAKFQPFFLLH